MSVQSWRQTVAEHVGVIQNTVDMIESQLDPAVELLKSAIMYQHKILACGNGGSAADAQHFVAELVVRYMADRNPIAAVTLSADTSVLTACANDYSYDQVFARQILAIGRPGDVLVAISTSGKSKNVIEAIHAARVRGMGVLALSGASGMCVSCDVDLNVPSIRTDRIQEAHSLIIHMLVENLERRIPQ